MPDIPALSLEHVLERCLGAPLYDGGQAIETVEGVRSRESRFRRWLPVKLVRRLDRGFGRSDTVQPDTARSLYAVARAVRPLLLLETGTYWGYSTAILAAAARDSGIGMVHSFDLYPHAGTHIPDSLRPWVHLHLGAPATESMPRVLTGLAPPTFFFQDSVHDYEGVLAELQTVLPFLAPDAVVVLHDFVVDGVRRAAVEALRGFFIAEIAGHDPQQLGIAIAPDRLVARR